MPVLVQVGRKQGTDRSADTRCSSLHGGIRRTKKREGISTQITRANRYLWGRNTGRAFSNSSCQDIFQHQEKMSPLQVNFMAPSCLLISSSQGKGSLRKTQLILGQGDWLLAGSGLQAAKVRGPLVSSAPRTSWSRPVCGSNSDSQTRAQDSTCGSWDLCLLRIRERLNSRKICGLSIKPAILWEVHRESQAYSKQQSSIAKLSRTILPPH